MYGGRVSDSYDRRVLITYLDEFFGDFLFDTFQPFHFYHNEHVDYKVRTSEIPSVDFVKSEMAAHTPPRTADAITNMP